MNYELAQIYRIVLKNKSHMFWRNKDLWVEINSAAHYYIKYELTRERDLTHFSLRYGYVYGLKRPETWDLRLIYVRALDNDCYPNWYIECDSKFLIVQYGGSKK